MGQARWSHTGWVSTWRPVITDLSVQNFRVEKSPWRGQSRLWLNRLVPNSPSFPVRKREERSKKGPFGNSSRDQRHFPLDTMTEEIFSTGCSRLRVLSEHVLTAHSHRWIMSKKRKTAWTVVEGGGNIGRSNFFANIFLRPCFLKPLLIKRQQQTERVRIKRWSNWLSVSS